MDIRKIWIFMLVFIMIALCFVPLNVVGQTPVNYSINYTDPTGDPEGMNVAGDIKNDADISAVKSSLQDEVFTLQLTVVGLIHIESPSSTNSYYYYFYLDINDDGEEDWTITVFNVIVVMATLEDDEGTHVYIISGENLTGNGTNTLNVKFPKEYITDEITAWNIYAETELSDMSSSNYLEWKEASDIAPDEAFGDTNGNGNGNGDEYTLDPTIQVQITKPTSGAEVKGSNEMMATYRIEGTSAPPAGGSIDSVEWRIEEAMVSDWQPCYDDSGSDDFSKWYGEISIYTIMGYGFMSEGDNTLEVRAVSADGGYNTATVVFKFTPLEDGNGNGNGDGSPDPATETPTDASIKIEITKATLEAKEDGDWISMELLIQGTTSGVDRLETTAVNYYKDGTHDDEVYWEEQYNYDGMKTSEFEMQYNHFKPTSADWKTWEYQVKGKFKSSGDGQDPGNTTKTIFYFRGFKDTSDDYWNQASKSLNMEITDGTDGGKKDDDGGGFLPGFETLIVVGAVVIILAVMFEQRRTKRQ